MAGGAYFLRLEGTAGKKVPALPAKTAASAGAAPLLPVMPSDGRC